MSNFLEDIIDGASSMFGGDGLGSSLARTALAGYALNQITNSLAPADANKAAIDPTNAAAVDKGVRQQVDASTDNRVPVVYGSAFTGGKIFDAYMTEDGTTMYFALAISEVTGTYSLQNESLGRIKFEAVYWNNSRVVFDIDNTTVLSLYDESSQSTVDLGGMVDPSGGLIKIWLYNDGSRYSTLTTDRWSPGSTYPSGTAWAFNVMPNWSPQHTCDKLVFAVVKVVYNKDKNVTGLGDLKFHITNPLNNPGDVIYDYMTNKRYGAGIDPQDINV
jgi:hypothetical protein